MNYCNCNTLSDWRLEILLATNKNRHFQAGREKRKVRERRARIHRENIKKKKKKKKENGLDLIDFFVPRESWRCKREKETERERERVSENVLRKFTLEKDDVCLLTRVSRDQSFFSTNRRKTYFVTIISQLRIFMHLRAWMNGNVIKETVPR